MAADADDHRVCARRASQDDRGPGPERERGNAQHVPRPWVQDRCRSQGPRYLRRHTTSRALMLSASLQLELPVALRMFDHSDASRATIARAGAEWAPVG